MIPDWIIDKSALLRLGATPDPEVWVERINRGTVRVCTVTVLEIGFSARSSRHWHDLVHGPPTSELVPLAMTPRIEARAIEVQEQLAGLGHHRAPSVADLLIAAAAELTGSTVLHVDKDFELIAQVTGQPTERLRLTTD